MKTILIILILIFVCNSFSQPPVSSDYRCVKEKNFNIFFTISDSTSARNALFILENAYEEITWDYHLSSSDTFLVLIVASRKEFLSYIKNRLPSWTEAMASPSLKRMMVKSPRWALSEESFSVSLVHELLHLILFRITKGKPVPRWLDEGLAIFYSNEKRWKTATALSRALLTNSVIPLTEIDRVLSFQHIRAELAYQQSFSATHYLLATYDIDAIQIILAGIRDNDDLATIFTRATGSDFTTFEKEWLQYAKKNYKWFWLSDINDLIWITMLLLFISAIIITRLRNKKIIQKWRQESDLGPDEEFEQEPDEESKQQSDQSPISE